jgi:hypothetical protein
MKLYEIIEANEKDKTSILIEKLIPYKKSLLTYYRNLFPSEPILMVTMVANAVQYAQIVPSDEFTEAISDWMGEPIDFDDEESDTYAEYETICANSIMLKDL